MSDDIFETITLQFEDYLNEIAREAADQIISATMSKLVAELFPVNDPSLEIRLISKVATMLDEKPSSEQNIRGIIADSYQRKFRKPSNVATCNDVLQFPTGPSEPGYGSPYYEYCREFIRHGDELNRYRWGSFSR